jgi:hypothetical protein
MDGHVTDEITTPASASPADEQAGASTTQDNWEQRYIGLQRVIAKRDEAMHTMTGELDSLRAEKEALLSQINDYTQARVDEAEEEAARQQYEALRERFDPTPVPVGNNPRGEWFNPEGRQYVAKTDLGDQSQQGWPT